MPNPGNNQSNLGNGGQTLVAKTHNPGKIVGDRYQIIRELSQGGFGKTYLAQDIASEHHDKCVVKQLQPRSNQPEIWQNAKQRFINEGLVQQRLGNHPYIPQVLAYFQEQQEFYLVQEYVDGEELHQEVERQPLNETQVIALLQDVLNILDFVHQQGVIHRDIKPSNLIRRKQDGKFVLIDFGAVKEITTLSFTPGGQRILTQMVGTNGFMPPEQIAGTPVFNSDIYALGRTAIYALTGRSPLGFAENQQGILSNWQNLCQISPSLVAIIQKMIMPKSTKRYASANHVLQDLQPFLKIETVVGGRYRLTRYLGGKSRTNTYLADNLWRHYQSPCVVKEIELSQYDTSSWQKIEQRFATELELLEQLGSNSQIPHLWDHFEENRTFYLVQEYTEGEALAQKLKNDQSLPENQVIELLKSTLEGLTFIHRHSLLHGNIKPSNLIISSSNNQVVLTDLDIFKHFTQFDSSNQSFSQAEESEVYISPEQIAGRPTVSSDLYALGIIAIQALTGINPKQFKTKQQTGEIIWQEEIEVNRKLAKIIDKMVSLHVDKRYQSADKVLSELNRLNHIPSTLNTVAKHRGSQPINNQPSSQADVGTPSLQRKNRLNLGYIMAALVGVIVMLGSIEFFFPIIRPFYFSYRGKQLLVEQPEEALSAFEQALDLRPGNSLAWKRKGDALFILEQFSEALAAYDESIRLQSNNSEAWRGRGDALYRLERFTAALTSFDKSLQLDPDNVQALNRKGRTFYQLERYEDAMAAQEEALTLDPNNAEALSDLGIALIGLGKYQEALTAFNKAQVIEPTDPRFWQGKALALEYLNQPQEAIRVYQEALVAYDKVLKKQPKNVVIWVDRGKVLGKLQFYEKALLSYDKAIAIRPNSHLAWSGKGNTLFAMGKYDEALAAFDRALEIQPGSYITWHNRGSLLQDGLKNISEAIASYDKAIAINPSFHNAWRDRGLALSQSGRYFQAIESYKKAIAISPNDYRAWVGRGIALASLNQQNEALAAFEHAQEIQPNDPFVWMNKGSALEQWQRYSEACDAYRQVKKINPGFSPAIQAMQRIGCRGS